MNILTETEILQRLNEVRGVQLERRTFGRSIRPLLIERGEAKQAARGRTQPWVYDGDSLWQYQQYLAVRAELIRRGEWSAKRPYTVRDLEDIALLDAHADVWDSLLARGRERADHAAS